MDKEMTRLCLSLSLLLCLNSFAREPQPASRSGISPPARSTRLRQDYGGQASAKKIVRARDIGVPFEGTPGPLNAITDVAGVEVGYTTIIRGDGKLVVGRGPVRTGVTAVI